MKELKNLMVELCKVNICDFCGCEFYFIGNLYARKVKYCSDECYTFASEAKTANHRLKALGTTELSSHRIEDFKKEHKRIRIEKRILHLI